MADSARTPKPGEVLAYVRRHGWGVLKHEQGRGGEVHLKVCPMCGHQTRDKAKGSFQINEETGVFDAYCCGETGGLLTLKKKMGDLHVSHGTRRGDEHAKRLQKAKGKDKKKTVALNQKMTEQLVKALDPDGEAYSYLEKVRKFRPNIIEKFKFGYSERWFWKCPKCGKEISRKGIPPLDEPKFCNACRKKVTGAKLERKMPLVAIPVFEGKKLVNVKYRSASKEEKHFEREPKCPSTLFNVDSLDGKTRHIIITECELDTVAAAQYQLKNVVGLTTGADSAISLLTPYLDDLVDYDTVYLALDNDEAGDRGCDEIANLLGKYRCKRVKLPFKDLCSCQESGVSQADIQAAIKAASDYQMSLVQHISEFEDSFQRMFDPATVGGKPMYDDALQEFLKGWRMGEVTGVTGDTKSGKTTWTLRQSLKQASHGEGVLVCNVEHKPDDTVRKLVAMHAGKQYATMTKDEVKTAFQELSAMPIYMVDHYGSIELDDLADAIEYGVRRYQLRFVMLDHLHFILPQDTENEVAEIGRFMKLVTGWAVRMDIHIWLVIHPHKLKEDRQGRVIPPDLNTLKGSSSIKQAIANGIRIHKPRSLSRKARKIDRAVITVLAVRYEGGREGAVAYKFDQEAQDYLLWDEDYDDDDASKKKKAKVKEREPGEDDVSEEEQRQYEQEQLELGGKKKPDDDDIPF